MDELGHVLYTPMCIDLLPPLHIIYAENPSESGKVHNLVWKKWLKGDPFITSTMEEIANGVIEGREALLKHNIDKLAELMNRNFDLRRSMFGDEALGALNMKMVETARKVGAAAKFTGSGGIIVVLCPNGPEQVKLLEDECKENGFIFETVRVVQSRLGEIDLRAMSPRHPSRSHGSPHHPSSPRHSILSPN